MNKIIQGDCLEEMKKIPDNSVDSIVTDPPYGISFMGKKWDYDVPKVEVWHEAMRVLKPGGHILVACGTRTQHRMAVNIEDAGFEIRDIVAWIYGSGFPKSLNIGKAVDKLQGNEREIMGDREVPDITGDAYGTMNEKQGGSYKQRVIQDTKGSSPWEGWGTALKPAMELWTLARKPLSEKTVAENVLRWGTGGLNIDESRVEYTGKTDPRTFGGKWKTNKIAKNVYEGGYEGKDQEVSSQGRFPANLIHDGSDEVVGMFPESKSGNGEATKYEKHGGQWGKGKQIRNADFGDSGSAARFFYAAKASKSERNRGLEGMEKKETKRYGDFEGTEDHAPKKNVINANHHPTVKPIKLMQYLVRLVTPKEGTVLDPFMGSGTTGMACKKENFSFIGIEREEDYCEIARKRIAETQMPIL